MPPPGERRSSAPGRWASAAEATREGPERAGGVLKLRGHRWYAGALVRTGGLAAMRPRCKKPVWQSVIAMSGGRSRSRTGHGCEPAPGGATVGWGSGSRRSQTNSMIAVCSASPTPFRNPKAACHELSTEEARALKVEVKSQRVAPTTPKELAPGQRRCVACATGFKPSTRQQSHCSRCMPGETQMSSRSVRTVSGGLPTPKRR